MNCAFGFDCVMLVSIRHPLLTAPSQVFLDGYSFKKIFINLSINRGKSDSVFGVSPVPFRGDKFRRPVEFEFLNNIIVKLAVLDNSPLANAFLSPNYGSLIRTLLVVCAVFITGSTDFSVYCGFVSAEHFGNF